VPAAFGFLPDSRRAKRYVDVWRDDETTIALLRADSRVRGHDRCRRGSPWSRDELLVAFRLYCRTPFGKLHQNNPKIIEMSRVLGRTRSAMGMKACNFASLEAKDA